MNSFENFIMGDKKPITPTYHTKDDEDKLVDNAQILFVTILIIGGLLAFIGFADEKGAIGIIGIVLIVGSVINYAIIIPLFKVIANISRNLKEINKKLDKDK